MKLNKQQITFLDKFSKGRWTLNEETGLVDIDGDFYGDGEQYSIPLTDFKGIRFGVVTGVFDCSNNELTSIEGAPQEVGRGFYCSYNQLTSLEGAPQKVGRGFNCSGNNLTSLEGSPQEVGEDFDCSYNSLKSLVGAPQKVRGAFICRKNKLKSLVGSPQEVGGYFDCSDSNLTSLEGSPQEVGEDFDCRFNSLTSLAGSPQKVGGAFDCRYNKLTSLAGAPQKVGSGLLCSDNKLGIPNYILDLMYETMKGCGVNYYVALHIHREAIEEEMNKILKQAEKRAGEMKNVLDHLDAHMTKEEQKAISVASRYGHFN